jgi:uncharacterized protein YndB with AHSA1/START domain
MRAGAYISVKVTHRFVASAERVFDAWLDPVRLGQWMFGRALRDEDIVRLTLAARVGGRFSFVVRRQGQELDHVGRYLEIDRPSRLVFTWTIAPESDDASQVVIHIAPVDGGCVLTLTHELHPDWAEYADRTRDAWAKVLGVLDTQLRCPSSLAGPSSIQRESALPRGPPPIETPLGRPPNSASQPVASRSGSPHETASNLSQSRRLRWLRRHSHLNQERRAARASGTRLR